MSERRSQTGPTHLQLLRLTPRPPPALPDGVPLHAEWRAESAVLAARGWVLALAHVRGGGELGHAWHHAGRATNKGRSASDLLAVVRGLQAWGYCDPARTAAQADSAGALALAGALNADPSRFGAVVRAAPQRRTCCTRRMPHATHAMRATHAVHAARASRCPPRARARVLRVQRQAARA